MLVGPRRCAEVAYHHLGGQLSAVAAMEDSNASFALLLIPLVTALDSMAANTAESGDFAVGLRLSSLSRNQLLLILLTAIFLALECTHLVDIERWPISLAHSTLFFWLLRSPVAKRAAFDCLALMIVRA